MIKSENYLKKLQLLKLFNAYAGNATEAAIKAGYSAKTARSAGQRMLKNVEIQKAIQERERE